MAYNLERRQSPRKRFDHLLYVEIEPGNGGMVLNFSEHGFGFRAVKRVRAKEEVKFAFNLADQRRLEGRGRLEWTDKEGRVAGLQFTEISSEFRSEMRNWLAKSSDAKASKGPAVAPVSAPGAAEESRDAGSQDSLEPSIAARRREALLRVASGKSVRSIASVPTPASASPALSQPVTLGEPPQPNFPPENSFVADRPRNGKPADVPWSAILPPAIGAERKPMAPTMKSPAAQKEFAGATAFKLSTFEPATAELQEVAEVAEEEAEPSSSMAAFDDRSPAAPKPAFENPIAAVEARTAGALNDHAQALLQHVQHEEQRMVVAFRESATRVLRDAERQLFPIRESAQAQIKSLESSIASATSAAKVLDQYPALLERAHQQALDRFQTQVQEVLHGHVMELRRRSDNVLQEVNARVAGTSLMPRRIRTSSGIIITAVMVMVLALLFMFRREAAGAFIWLGQQMVEPAAPSDSGKTAANGAPEPKVKTEPSTSAETAPKAVPPAPISKPADPTLAPQPAASPAKDVRALWADIANGDVSAEITLGNMYYAGHGVTKNCSQAHRLFTAAARKGNQEGKRMLAELDSGGCR